MTNPSKPTRVERARSLFIDGAVVIGFGLLTYGSMLVYSPAGFIVPGVLLLGVGLMGARR